MKNYGIFLIPLLIITMSSYSQENKEEKVLVIAHRGASGYAPENTLASIKKALEIGVDMIEIDVHQSKDGKVVVIHDETLDRTTSGEGLVKDQLWEQMRILDAGIWKGEEFKGERLPLLEDVIDKINGQCQLLIEVKNGGDYYPGIEKSVWQIVQDKNAQNWCVIQSFKDVVVENFMQLNTNMPIYKLVVGNIPVLPFRVDTKLKLGSVLKYKEYDGVNPNKKFVRKRIVRKLHKRGQKTFVWTVNKKDDMKDIIEKGVDGIITNYPDKLKEVINELE